MRIALDDAHAGAGEVDYVNAHGSSTPLNDSTETAAIKSVFGEHAYRLAVRGSQGYHGPALGASAARMTGKTASGARNVAAASTHCTRSSPKASAHPTASARPT